MHPDFPIWYRALALSPSTDLLQLRWRAIEELTEQSLTDEEVLDLVRLARGAPPDAVVGSAVVREAAVAPDAQFPASGNKLELQVLAAAALAALFCERGQQATLAALALTCAQFGAQGRDRLIPDMTGPAEEYLFAQGQQVRTEEDGPASVTTEQLSAAVKALQVAENAITEQGATDEARAAFVKAASQVMASAKRCAAARRAEREHLEWCETVWREQAEILWWYVRRNSPRLCGSIDEGSAAEACLVIGEDLADRIRLLPGPIYAKAVLVEFLGPAAANSEISVRDAEQAAPAEWRARWLAQYGEAVATAGDLCPIASVIHQGAELPRNADAPRCPITEFSHQFYLENLLLQCLRDADQFYY